MSGPNGMNGSPPPEPDDPAARRREKLMAYHLDALDDDEAALIRGRIGSDPDWKKASEEALAMIEGLKADGTPAVDLPERLGERTAERLRGAREERRKAKEEERRALPKVPFAFTARVAAAIFVVASLPAMWLGSKYVFSKPERVSVLWKAEGELAAGAPWAPFLMVRDTTTKEPISGVTIKASLEPTDRLEDSAFAWIGEGASDAAGVVAGEQWRVPEVPPGDYRLVVEARSSWGNVLDRVEREVKVVNAARLALSPDRTQARPGETIRVRTLLATEAGTKPLAGKPVAIDLVDPEGNRIGRSETKTSDFGLAWAEFPLDTLAREGDYKVRAESEGLKAEETVEVKQYRLPAYRVSVALDRTWFGVRDRISGRVTARTFDGHAVGEAKGEVRLISESGKPVRKAGIELDRLGSARLSLAPVGADAVGDTDVSRMRLEVALVDPAGRRAEKKLLVPVSRTAVVIHAVAEAGELVPGVENIVYVVARRPDGSPLRGELTIEREGIETKKRTVETDEHGVAAIKLEDPQEPAEVLLVGGTADGKRFEARRISLSLRPFEQKGSGHYGGLLLRTDRAVVSAGDELKVTVLSAAEGGAATLALRQNGRPVSVAGAEIDGDRGEATISVPTGLSGMLTLDAILPVEGRQLWTDSRVVSVAGDKNVKLAATVDRPHYRPGDTARLDFRVTDAGGQGIPAAVSVVAVDEALLELTGDHPGLAQALQAVGVNALRTPGFPLDATAFGLDEGTTEAARAALAAVRMPTPVSISAHLDELVRKEYMTADLAESLRRHFAEPASDDQGATRDYLVRSMKENGLWDKMAPVLGIAGPVGSSDSVVDTAPAKAALHRQQNRRVASAIEQWLLGLLGVAVVLGILVAAWRPGDEREGLLRRALDGVPIATLCLGGVGVLSVMALGIRATHVAAALVAMAIAAHILLLVRASWVRRGVSRDIDTTDRLGITAFIFDAILALLAVSIVSADHQRDAIGLVLVTGIVAFIALLFLYGASRPRTYRSWALQVTSVLLVCGILAGLLLPALASSRERARRTRAVSDLKQLEYAMMMHEDGNPGGLKTPAETQATGPRKPRLRWDFPETWIFAPQVVTDADGRATLEVPTADSLTTWRVQADAIASRGGASWTTAKVVVTQPFSMDLVLPTDVTAGDILYVPVAVSNHTSEPKRVALTLKVVGASVIDGTTRTIRVPAKAVASAEYGLRFRDPGTATLRVTALAGEQGDAVERTLAVLPDGRPVGFSSSAFIDDAGALAVMVPLNAIPGTIHSELRLHRGPLSQITDGLESMLREPYGCFEQTSSSTYPNVLVLSYLKATDTAKPEIEKRAKAYIARGYQRLLGFEVGSKTGSFSLYGKAPASTWLTAYGLMEFTDMARVHDVDPALLERIRAWLGSRVRADGSFAMHSHYAPRGSGLGVAGTAYAVWGLGKDAPQKSVDFLRGRLPDIQNSAYLCALVANALADTDRATAGHLAGKLRGLATISGEGKRRKAHLGADRTLAWGYGRTASVEATALGVLALLETGTDMELAKMLIASLQERVSPGGGWGSTHATILALKALVRSASVGREAGPARVIVDIDGRTLAPIDLPAEETAIPASVKLGLTPGRSNVRLRVSGGPVAARVTGQAYVPWTAVAAPAASPIAADVSYSSKRVGRNQSVLGTLTVTSKGRTAEVPMVEWGMPAGFIPEAEDLDGLKTKGTISHWERSGRTLRLYLPDLATGRRVTISVRFYATAKGTLKGPAGKVYEYYRRHEAAPLEPEQFEVF